MLSSSRRGARAMSSVRFNSDEAISVNNSGDASGESLILGPIHGNSETSSDRRSAKNNMSFSLFRNIFHQRSQDYRSDRRFDPSASRRVATNPRSSNGGMGNPVSVPPAEEESAAALSQMQRCCSAMGSYTRPSRATLDRLSGLITSRTWHAILVFCTILLLFGSEIQELWFPKAS